MIRKYFIKLYQKLLYYFGSPEAYAKFIGVKIGENCKISSKSFSSEPFLIQIGSNVRIAKEVLFLTHGGIWSLRKIDPQLADFDYFGKITIGNNVYIGQRAIIMPGVTIEDNCIIGAATIVNKSIRKNTVVAGNPVRIISDLGTYITKIKTKGIDIHSLSVKNKMEFIKNLNDESFVTKEFL